VRFELASLGTWGGARLIAEFDPESDVIRVDAAACERVRKRLGDAAAERFVAYAVAHERFHAARPDCGEAEAHEFARAATGVERALFEDALRA
jgi:hypothetical protein